MNKLNIRKFEFIGIIAIFILLFLVIVPTAFAVTETRYHRSDTHTINGLNAYQMGTSQSTTGLTDFSVGATAPFPYCPPGRWQADVYKRAADGAETALGSNVAVLTGQYNGYYSATWSAPQTALSPTDAIKVVEELCHPAGDVWNSRTWITPQLNAIQLDAATWTFQRHCHYTCDCSEQEGICFIGYTLNHGSASYNTRIEGFSYTTIVAPTVTTQDATNITSSQATLNGTITATGGENAVERGFDWGTSPGSYPNSWTESGSFGTGAFNRTITGLTENTTYYFRAKAQNSAGWSYGSEKSFTTLTAYIDCGLRIYDGSAVRVIACEPAGTLTSPLRIRKGATTYGIVLVATSDANASKIRIQTSSGIKALRKY